MTLSYLGFILIGCGLIYMAFFAWTEVIRPIYNSDALRRHRQFKKQFKRRR